VQRAPRSGPAHQALGRYYLDHGQTFEAVWELAAAHRLQPEERATALQLAVALASGGLYDPAIRQLESLTAQRPPSREGRVQLATLYLGTLQPKQALAVLRQAPDLTHWREGQIALGQVEEAMGEMERAAAAYQRARRLAPNSSEPLSRLARLDVQQGDIAAARAALEQARQITGSSAAVLTALAETYLHGGPGLNPRSVPNESRLRGLGDGTHAGGFGPGTDRGFNPGERWLRAALEADPASVPALVDLAQLRWRQHHLKDAFELYTAALKAAPGDTAANAGLADLLQAAGRTAEAHGARAHYFRAKGLPMRAIQEYEAMARFPEYQTPAVMETGLILLETRQKERALQVTQAALARHPRDPALYERMVVLEMMWDHVQAQRWCEQWQRLDPHSLRPVWLLGRITADRGELTRGIRLLQQVVAAEPQNTDYTITLAELLMRRRDRASLARARQLLEAAAARPGAEAKTYADLGQVLVALDQPDAAQRAFLRSLDLDPNVSDPYVSLVRLAPRLGQPEQAELWGPLVRTIEDRLREETLLSRQTWEQPSDPSGHEALALHFLRNAELRKAESQLEESLRLRPGWPEAQQTLAAVRRTREVL
jgi:tetratricopeptide (TPR) repeat protein